MTARPAELRWSNSGGDEQRITLVSGAYRIGRDPSAQIRIDAPGVSLQHALLEKVGDAWLLSDLHSTNGLWWRGRRIQQLLLCDGDRIQLAPGTDQASAELQFHHPARRLWQRLRLGGSAAVAVVAARVVWLDRTARRPDRLRARSVLGAWL